MRKRKSLCFIALKVAHAAADRMGRALHPIEVRWVVQHEFRRRFPGLTSSMANQFADRAIREVRALVSADGGWS